MKAIEITQYGAPEVLKLTERPRPELKPGEVLIKVTASGVNRPDVLQRIGQYPVPPGASDLPGLEVAGEIVDGKLDGPDNRWGLKVGCAAPLSQVLPVPQGLSDVEAASLPETFFTVWSNVFDRAHLGETESGEKETLLVQGGTSGIGVTAIQLGVAMGHRVFATAGSDEKARACEALGAERGINYKTEDFVAVTKALTSDRGVDVVLDMVGGDYLPREVQALAFDGRIAVIALLGGSKATLDMGALLRRRLTVTGSTLRPRSVAFKAAIAQNLYEKVWPLFAAGKIRPVIYQTFPADQADKAHALMETSTHVGKIVLTW